MVPGIQRGPWHTFLSGVDIVRDYAKLLNECEQDNKEVFKLGMCEELIFIARSLLKERDDLLAAAVLLTESTHHQDLYDNAMVGLHEAIEDSNSK